MSNGSKLHCPYCGGRQLQVATSTRFSTSTNVTRKEVTTTVLSQNTRYWCCADCGSTFPFPQDVKQQADAIAYRMASNKKTLPVCVIAATLCLFGAASPAAGIMITLSMILYLLAALGAFVTQPLLLKQYEQLQKEYEDLISKCME